MTESAPGRIARLAKVFHHHLPLASTTSSTPQPAGPVGEVFQYSTLEALLGGVYDGDVTIGELLTHGDFGLGTFNSLDGEMIVLDGICYHLRSDGTAQVAAHIAPSWRMVGNGSTAIFRTPGISTERLLPSI